MRDTTVASGKEDRDSVCASPLRSVRRHIQFGWALAQIKFGEASAKERMLHLLTKLMSNQLGTLTPPPPRLVDGAYLLSPELKRLGSQLQCHPKRIHTFIA